jgi:hypothetical protein
LRTFNSGATRDSDDDKLDFDGFLSPEALLAFAKYMHKHRIQADGTKRPGDNWKKGIPLEAYRKSMWRHFFDAWYGLHYRESSGASSAHLQDALCALLFNVQGALDLLIQEEKSQREVDAVD